MRAVRLCRAAQDESHQKRFLREAATYAKPNHPNTVSIIDYGELEVRGVPTFFMVTEYVEGQPGRSFVGSLRIDF